MNLSNIPGCGICSVPVTGTIRYELTQTIIVGFGAVSPGVDVMTAAALWIHAEAFRVDHSLTAVYYHSYCTYVLILPMQK